MSLLSVLNVLVWFVSSVLICTSCTFIYVFRQTLETRELDERVFCVNPPRLNCIHCTWITVWRVMWLCRLIHSFFSSSCVTSNFNIRISTLFSFYIDTKARPRGGTHTRQQVRHDQRAYTPPQTLSISETLLLPRCGAYSLVLVISWIIHEKDGIIRRKGWRSDMQSTSNWNCCDVRHRTATKTRRVPSLYSQFEVVYLF